MAKGKTTKSMRTLTVIDVETYLPEDIDFMRKALSDMSGENYLLDMAEFMQLLKTTVNKEKLENFICTLKQMNMISKRSTDGNSGRKATPKGK